MGAMNGNIQTPQQGATPRGSVPPTSGPITPQQQAANTLTRQSQASDQITAAQMGAMGGNLVVGEEYVIQYSNGRKVVGTWDGKFFKIKPPVSGACGKLCRMGFLYCVENCTL